MNNQVTMGNKKIEDFLEELASKSPTPGGGSVAALAGAMAAGLVEMVWNITKNVDTELQRNKLKNLRLELLKLADEDSKAFDKVMEAYRSKDKSKIRESLQKAIDAPAKVKRLSIEIEKLAKVAAKKGNKNAFSDAKTAIYLARASQKSAEENVKINMIALARLGRS